MHDSPKTAAGWLLPVVLIAVMILEILHLFSGLGWARTAAHGVMLPVIALAFRRLGLREAYLLSVSAVLSVLLWRYHPVPLDAAMRALDQAVFLMAFILLISLIQEAALTSRSVASLGQFLAGLPGGRRFFGLFGGTMAMSVVFNIGTMTLLAPLIRKAAETAESDPLSGVRARRQYNALLRGFAWSVVWSPTAIAPLALYGLIDGIDRGRWIALGLGISLIMMMIGWAEDRFAFRGQTAAALGLPSPPRPELSLPALGRFSLVCLALAGVAAAVMLSSGRGVPPSLMLAAPAVMIMWLIGQSAELPIRLKRIAQSGLPASAPMAVTLACSGYVGIAAAALVPAEDVAAWIGLERCPAWLFLLGTTLSVTALSQLALSPIMMSVFFGALLGSLPSLPADPTLTALAVATGWAVSTTWSPFASGVIMLSRISGHTGRLLAYHWNTVYTCLTVGALAVIYAALT